MAYRFMFYISIFLIVIYSTAAVDISSGTKIGLTDLNSNITLGNNITVDNLTVYGNSFELENTSISVSRVGNNSSVKMYRFSNKSYKFSSLNENVSRINLSFSNLPAASGYFRLGDSQESVYSETSRINGSFDLEYHENITLSTVAQLPDEGDSGSSSDDGSSTETNDQQEEEEETSSGVTGISPSPSDNTEPENSDESDTGSPESIRSELESDSSENIEVETEENTTVISAEKRSLAALTSSKRLRNKLKDLRQFKEQVENSTSSGDFIEKSKFDAALINITEGNDTIINITTRNSESSSYLDASDEKIHYHYESKDLEDMRKVNVTISDSDNVTFAKIVSTNGSMIEGNISRSKIGDQESYFLNVSEAENKNSGEKVLKTVKDERNNPKGLEIILAAIGLILGVIAIRYILEDKFKSKINNDTENHIATIHEEAEVEEVSEKARRITENLDSSVKMPRTAYIRAQEARKALKEQDYNRLNEKLDSLERIVEIEG